MKMILCILLALPVFSNAQKVALLSNELKRPIIYTDSVTMDQISNNYFPIQANTFDTIYSQLKYLKELLSTKIQRAKMQSFELRSGSSKIKVTAVKHAYGDSYDIDFISKFDEIQSNFQLSNNEKLNKGSIKKIEKLMAYMKNASMLFKTAYVEMTPRLYEVIIYKQ
jgi:hypothetical protein